MTNLDVIFLGVVAVGHIVTPLFVMWLADSLDG